MYYSELEKRAIITMANKMVLADGEVRIEELASAGRTLDLMMGFTKEDSLLRELPFNQAKSVIDGFPENKKRATAALLISIMISDNDVAEEEAVLLDHISDFCGLPRLNFEEYQDALAEMVYDKLVDEHREDTKGSTHNSFYNDLITGNNSPCNGSWEFKSSGHIRFQKGHEVSNSAGCHRTVKVEKNVSGNRGYTVTVYNDDGVHPLWGTNVQMSPKPMEVVSRKDNQIVLRGYGYDQEALSFGVSREDASFADYGMTLVLNDNQVEKCILHMYDRSVDIEYYM